MKQITNNRCYPCTPPSNTSLAPSRAPAPPSQFHNHNTVNSGHARRCYGQHAHPLYLALQLRLLGPLHSRRRRGGQTPVEDVRTRRRTPRRPESGIKRQLGCVPCRRLPCLGRERGRSVYFAACSLTNGANRCSRPRRLRFSSSRVQASSSTSAGRSSACSKPKVSMSPPAPRLLEI